jgi:chaperonin GroES
MLTPLNGIVVLKKIEEQEVTYGNIVIPDMGKEKPEMGEVVSASDTYNWHRGDYYKTKLVPGQKVLIPKMGSMAITLNNEDYILIKETEILAILEN